MVNHWRFQGLGTHPSKTPVANEQQVIHHARYQQT